MTPTRRALLLATPFLATPALAQAQWSPERAMRFIVPFPAGGSSDVQARLIAEPLARALGQPVVVENRPGAGGVIGATEAARAAPDGHTIFIATTGTHAANVSLYSRLAYDPVRDFAPITMVADYAQFIGVGPDWPAPPQRSLEGLVAALRADATKRAYASSGNGSPTHLAGEMFGHLFGVRMEHIPYRGQALAVADVIAGRVPLMFPSIADVLGQIRAGRVTPLATMAPTRSTALPEVPTTAELGHPSLVSSIWTAIFARAGSPPAAVARLNAEIVRILAAPELAQRLGEAGFGVQSSTPEELARFQGEEITRWAEVVRISGAKLD